MENKVLLKKCEECEMVIDLSGIALCACDSTGDYFDLSSKDLALMAVIITRNDLSDLEKAMMLHGAIHSSCVKDFFEINDQKNIEE